MPNLDLSSIEHIQKASLDELSNQEELEKIICKLGFNTEQLHEQPNIVKQNGGGLHIWQYPNQFAKYLLFLKSLPITSYLEIGCRWGGTFILTCEYLARFNTMTHNLAVDIIASPVSEYCNKTSISKFMQISSNSDRFKEYIRHLRFDIIFIDGDHSYEAVKKDFETCRHSTNIFVFHDVVSDACPGVKRIWQEIKQSNMFDSHEFVEQYGDVWNKTKQKFLGIGIAIKKS